MGKKIRVGIYARVSTGEQRTELQVVELKEYIARRGWTLAATYIDRGFSGATPSRPQLDSLISILQRRVGLNVQALGSFWYSCAPTLIGSPKGLIRGGGRIDSTGRILGIPKANVKDNLEADL